MDYMEIAEEELGSEIYQYPALIGFLEETQEYIEKVKDYMFWESGTKMESFEEFRERRDKKA